MIAPDRLKEIRALFAQPEFKRPVCRGSLTLGTGCKTCEKCSWHYRIAGTSQIIPELLDEIERLREALRFYADEKNYYEDYEINYPFRTTKINHDRGQSARKVLGDE